MMKRKENIEVILHKIYYNANVLVIVLNKNNGMKKWKCLKKIEIYYMSIKAP